MNWLFSFDFLFFFILTSIFLYLICRAKKKTYPFYGLENDQIKFKKRRIYQSESKGEKRCRIVFEKLFNCQFKKDRPDFLKNPITGKNLELDGVNYEIKTPLGRGLAFEYDGAQHMNYNSHFHKDANSFIYQARKDSFKDQVCKNKGILLLRIPYYIPLEELEHHILKILRQEGLLKN